MPTDDPARRVRSRLLDEHRTVLEAVVDAAADVAARWDADVTTDRHAIVDALERELHRRSLHERFPDLIADAVAVAGFELRAPPVAAPPYVVVTSTGPVLRATVPTGRLVIELNVFTIERNPVRYRRRRGDVDGALDVRFVTD